MNIKKAQKRTKYPRAISLSKIGEKDQLKSTDGVQNKRTSSRISVKNPSHKIKLSQTNDIVDSLLKRKHRREWIKRGMNCNWTVSEVYYMINKRIICLKNLFERIMLKIGKI
jgi:hypothetical protein